MYTSTTKEAKKIKILFEDQVTNGPIFYRKFFLWSTIIEVKKELEHLLKVPPSKMRLFYKNIELAKNGRRLLDYNIKHKDYFVVKMTPDLIDSLGVVNPYRIFEEMPKDIVEILEAVNEGFRKGYRPRLTENGTSGTYFLENYAKRVVAIFKPFDEEPFAPNNPRNFVGELNGPGFRSGILSGESATRYVAAYMISNSYHDVPATTYVEFYHPSFYEREQDAPRPIKSERYFELEQGRKTKHGSLQKFAAHDDVVCNFSCNVFSVEQVQKIAILDLRILNCDRNYYNILVKKSQSYIETSGGTKLKKYYELIPIDHGLSFPDNFHIYEHEIVWMDWPQIRQPLTDKALDFIRNIDPAKDCKILEETLGFRDICLRNFRIAETFIKMAASMGFTIQDMARMMYRKYLESLASDEEEEGRELPKDAELSEIYKLVREVYDFYFTMKDNKYEPTKKFIMDLLGPAKKNIKMQSHLQKLLLIYEEDSETETNYSKNNLPPDSSTVSPTIKRSLSLPNIRNRHEATNEKTKDSKLKSKKDLTKQESFTKPTVRESKISAYKWDETFFYYLEDRMKIFLRYKQNKTVKRNRFNSEFLE